MVKIIIGFIVTSLVFTIVFILGVLHKYIEDRYKYKMKECKLNIDFVKLIISDKDYLNETFASGIMNIVFIILATSIFYILGDVILNA